MQVDNLRSTCTLTEMVLNGKDIELLLLKKDVQDKLTALGDIDVKPLPATVQKQIEFAPGTVDFGRLHDRDRATMRQRDDDAAARRAAGVVARATQTDCDHPGRRAALRDFSTQTEN